MKKSMKVWIGVGALVVIAVAVFLVKRHIGPIVVPGKDSTLANTASGAAVPGITVPAGFKLSVFAKGVTDARVIAFDPTGNMVVSETSEGKIVRIADANSDGIADGVTTILSGLDKPHGIAFRCVAGIAESNSKQHFSQNSGQSCTMYIGEHGQLASVSYATDAQGNVQLGTPQKLMDITAAVTDRHFTRSLLFLPAPDDSTLLISVGSSCNTCHDTGDHGKVLYYNVDTSEHGDYAAGLRNATFMTLNPVTGKVFATEMGRDEIGDDTPPDEIDVIEKGKNYGWPICYGKNIHDTAFDKNVYIRDPCASMTPSWVDLQAHSAPLGITFVPEEGWPEQYWYHALVAYHGSWNRSTPTGYKIADIALDAKGNYLSTSDFATGWLTDTNKKTGRPVDIVALPGGVAYISDDQNGEIYKLTLDAQPGE